MAAPRRLGFIGLGNIGGGVCANLLADGHEVTALDLDPARLSAMVEAGARPGGSPAEVASASELTFLSLPTPEVMAAVAEAWLDGAQPGNVLVDLTTNSPSTVREVGRRLEGAGVRMVEAPLTGGAIGARHRKLVFITGGDRDLVEEVTPLLDSIGRATFYMGPLGSGNVAKLVNSLMAFTTMWVSLEGLALGAANGLDLRNLLEMVRTSGGANSYLAQRVEEISERGRHPDFAMRLAAKDAGLMLEAGREASVPMPVASAIHQMLVYATSQGLGDRDISDLVEVMERAAGLRIELGPAETS